MERQRGAQTLLIAVLAVAVLAMSIGFAAAAYTQTLNINGQNVTAQAAKWEVKFNDASYTETTGTGYVAANTHSVDATSWTFDVTLAPGETYEATVPVVNTGTFDAKLVGITMSSLTSDQAKYLTYTITYNNGATYSATTSGLDVTLPKTSGSHPVKVTVHYYVPTTPGDLPSTNQTITLSASLNYESVVQSGA